MVTGGHPLFWGPFWYRFALKYFLPAFLLHGAAYIHFTEGWPFLQLSLVLAGLAFSLLNFGMQWPRPPRLWSPYQFLDMTLDIFFAAMLVVMLMYLDPVVQKVGIPVLVMVQLTLLGYGCMITCVQAQESPTHDMASRYGSFMVSTGVS